MKTFLESDFFMLHYKEKSREKKGKSVVDDKTKKAHQFLQKYHDPLKFFTVENRITDNVGLNDKT
jgi:hypothetical protein